MGRRGTRGRQKPPRSPRLPPPAEGWVLWQAYGGAMVSLGAFLKQQGCGEALERKTAAAADGAALAALLDATQLATDKGPAGPLAHV